MYNRFLSGEAAPVPSLTSLYPAADWYEREAYDLFGVLFAGHSDLRRPLSKHLGCRSFHQQHSRADRTDAGRRRLHSSALCQAMSSALSLRFSPYLWLLMLSP